MIKLKTDVLKDLVTKASKGVSIDALIPITNFMCIKLVNGLLEVITTDSTNYMYAESLVDGVDEFYVVVPTDIFIKLVTKITSEYIALDITDNILTIEGNGKYKIPLSLDEDGSVIKFKDPMKDIEVLDDLVYLDVEELRNVIKALKPSLYTNNNIPCLTKYYFGACVLTSDKDQVGCYSKSLTPEPVLLSQYMLNILDVITSDTIAYAKTDKYVILKADGVTMCGICDDDVNTFPVDAIEGILNLDLTSNCKVRKNDLVDVLSRVALFIGIYDDNSIIFNFNEDGVEISSTASNGVEYIEYVGLSNYIPFSCKIDCNMLLKQIKAYPNDVLDIYFGHDAVIGFKHKELRQLLALKH